MAARKTPSPKKKPQAAPPARRGPLRLLGLWLARGMLAVVTVVTAFVLLYAFVPPPMNIYQWQEHRRLGGLERTWVDWDQIAPVMARSVVAAEDANFCLHWGFDMAAIRLAIEEGGNRGASTLSQQVVKNVFLWHGRNWQRKALEAMLTPVVEFVWTKRRIVEVYLNVAEFGTGVFGVEAAARHHFGVKASELTSVQAARLAAVLPNPKERDAGKPSDFVRKRAAQIVDGAATIRADGRAACFEDAQEKPD